MHIIINQIFQSYIVLAGITMNQEAVFGDRYLYRITSMLSKYDTLFFSNSWIYPKSIYLSYKEKQRSIVNKAYKYLFSNRQRHQPDNREIVPVYRENASLVIKSYISRRNGKTEVSHTCNFLFSSFNQIKE